MTRLPGRWVVVGLLLGLLCGPGRAAAQDVVTSLTVLDNDTRVDRVRDLAFGTLAGGGTPMTVTPSVAGGQSGLYEITGMRNRRQVLFRLTLPTRLQNLTIVGSTMPVKWNGAYVISCTRSGNLACDPATERSWTPGPEPGGAPLTYTYDFTVCGGYTTPTGTTCSGTKFPNAAGPLVYVALGGRVEPAAGQPAGIYSERVTLTVLSISN